VFVGRLLLLPRVQSGQITRSSDCLGVKNPSVWIIGVICKPVMKVGSKNPWRHTFCRIASLLLGDLTVLRYSRITLTPDVSQFRTVLGIQKSRFTFLISLS
jgi:hypothetical protein